MKLIKEEKKSAPNDGSFYFAFRKLPRLRSHGSYDAEFISPIAQEMNYFGQSLNGLGFVAVGMHEDDYERRRIIPQVFQNVVDLSRGIGLGRRGVLGQDVPIMFDITATVNH